MARNSIYAKRSTTARDDARVNGAAAKRYRAVRNLLLSSLCAVFVTGCGSEPRGTGSDPNGSSSASLSLGAHGPAVRALYERLWQIGYFPNETLAAQYPAWRAVVPVTPPSPDVFDANIEQAVRKFQINHGLSENGTVDGPTHVALYDLQCGFPDEDPLLDPTDKFDIALCPGGDCTQPAPNFTVAPSWSQPQVTYHINNGTPTQQAYVSTAANNWNNAIDIGPTTLSQTPSSGNISVTWCAPGTSVCSQVANCQSGCVACPNCGTCGLTCGGPGSNPVNVFFDSNATVGLVMHELGHALGLNHSSITPAVMFPTNPAGGATNDDLTAIRGLYPGWSNLGGYARDVAASAGNTSVWQNSGSSCATGTACVWAIGGGSIDSNGNGGVFNYNFGFGQQGWNQVGTMGANRIAVDDSGRPWVVDTSGRIFRLNLSNNTWQQLPDLAADIGVSGFSTTSTGSAYKVEIDNNTNAGGGGVFQWSESQFRWIGPVANGFGVRIAVSNGTPYVVNKLNGIFRLQNGSWQQLPGAAVDIGANGGFVWVGGTGSVGNGNFGVWVWDEQAAGGGNPPARALANWVPVAGGITNIAVGTGLTSGAVAGGMMPFAVNSFGQVFMLQ
jgi:hypothetical protein